MLAPQLSVPKQGGYQQPAKPIGRPAGAQGPPSNDDAKKWQHAYLELQQERQQMAHQLQQRMQERQSYIQERGRLQDLLGKEQEQNNLQAAELRQRMEWLQKENTRLQQQLMRSQLQESAKDSEVATVKRVVMEKAMLLDKELQYIESSHLHMIRQIRDITNSLGLSSGNADGYDTSATGPGPSEPPRFPGAHGRSGFGSTVSDSISIRRANSPSRASDLGPRPMDRPVRGGNRPRGMSPEMRIASRDPSVLSETSAAQTRPL